MLDVGLGLWGPRTPARTPINSIHSGFSSLELLRPPTGFHECPPDPLCPPSGPQGSGRPPFKPGLTHGSPLVPVRLALWYYCPSWGTSQCFIAYLFSRTSFYINERPIRARQYGVYTMLCGVHAFIIPSLVQ